MSFSTIKIYRQLPIINKYVQFPNNREQDKTAVLATEAQDLIAGSVLKQLSLGSGRQTGSKFGAQQFLQLPGISPNEWYESDPVAALQ